MLLCIYNKNNGSNNIKELLEMVLKDKKEADQIEAKLFTILKEEYGIKYPYQEIPINLEYVLKIVS